MEVIEILENVFSFLKSLIKVLGDFFSQFFPSNDDGDNEAPQE